MIRTIAKLRFVLLVSILAMYFGRTDRVRAQPITVDWCSNVCGQEVSCNEPCLILPPELPAMEVTCGQYDGGPTNDHCDGDGCEEECSWWSLPSDSCWWEDEETDCGDYGEYGICGDGTCAAWLAEDCTSCEEDCGCPIDPEPECPNQQCEPGETWRTCPADCPEPPEEEDDCGNDSCETTENGDSCPEDCTFSGDACGGFQDCPTGWECVNDVCVWEDPEYKCCGGTGCANQNGQAACSFGQVCKAMFGYAGLVCAPIWPNGSLTPKLNR